MRIDLIANYSSTTIEWLVLLSPVLDLIAKSVSILIIALIVVYLFRSILSPTSRHFIWLLVLACIALMPLLTRYIEAVPEQEFSNSMFDVVTVLLVPTEDISGAATVGNTQDPIKGWTNNAAAFYWVVSSLLLLRLLFDLVKVFRISRRARSLTSLKMIKEVNRLRHRLEISRPVTVKFSEDIASPISLGVLNPVVIFPRFAEEWPEQIFSSALSHEMSHISRLDWLSSTSSYVLCSLFWLNPCTWYAMYRMNVEAELACDVSVLRIGVDHKSYAEHLLSITRRCRSAMDEKLQAQNMLSASLLKERVTLLLDLDSNYLESAYKSSLLILVFSVFILVVLDAGNFIRIRVVGAAIVQNSWLMSQAENLIGVDPEGFSSTPGYFDGSAMSSQFYNPLPIAPPVAVEQPLLRLDAGDRVQKITSEMNSENAARYLQDQARSPAFGAEQELQLIDIRNVDLELSTSSTIHASESSNHDELSEIPARNTLSRLELKQEIDRIENEYYRVFNEREKDKSLHIVCESYMPTGSFISKKYCEPRFVIDARSLSLRVNHDFSAMLHSSSALQGETRGKFQELTTAINNALRFDPNLRSLHEYLLELKSAI